jgi:hypothetical protein
MRVDAYTRFFLQRFFAKLMDVAGDYKDMGKRVRLIPALHDLDHRKRLVDSFPDYAQIPERGTMYPRFALQILDSLDLSSADRETIDCKNLEAVTGRKLVG